MKKILFLLVLASCQKKTVPLVTERKTDPPRKISSIYPPQATVAADTLAGKRLFAGRCGRCHGLPDIHQFNAKRWDDILPLMFPRSGFNNEEALHVRTWVLANAKQ